MPPPWKDHLPQEAWRPRLSSPNDPPAETPTAIPAEITAKYDGLAEVHRGGMGVVYRGRHRHLDRWDAIKLILPYELRDESRRQRFLREARIASRFKHPHIVRIHDFEITRSGIPYLVMELIEGRMLASLLREEGPPPLPHALTIARQIAQALGYIHHQGYVHRDVSTKNLMLESEDPPRVKLVDLGIAKRLGDGGDLTRSDEFLFNARYASPEHFKNSQELDNRSDLYSSGVVLYELFTGHRPLRGESMEELVAGHLFEAPLPFTETDPEGRLPTPLRQILRRLLEKNPADRFQNAEHLEEELEKIGAAAPAPITIDTGATTASRQALIDFALRAEQNDLSAEQRLPTAAQGGSQGPPYKSLLEDTTQEAPPSAAGSEAKSTSSAPTFSLRRLRPWLSLAAVAAFVFFAEGTASWTPQNRLPGPQLLPAPGQVAKPHPSNSPDLAWSEVFEMADRLGSLDPEFPYVYQIAAESDPEFKRPLLELGIRRRSPAPVDVQLPQVAKPIPPPHPVEGPVRTVLEDGVYLWRVARQDHYGDLGGFSAVARFEFDATPAAAPEVLTGEDRPTMDRTPTFTWEAPADAAEVQIQVALDRGFEEVLWDETLPANTQMNWQVPDTDPLPEGDVYWRLGSIDRARNPVQYTEAKHFTVDVTAPVLPTPVTLGGPSRDPRPVFTWSQVDDAASYEIVLGRGEDLRNIFLREQVEETRFRPPTALPEERVAWWVRSRDEAGNQLRDFAHGGILELDYTPPPAPSANCPAEPLTNEPDPRLEWTATAGTATYHLQLARDAGFAPLLREVPELPSGQGATWKPVARLPEGDVFWRVKSRDRAGNESAHSTTCRLLIDTVPPKVPTLRAVRPTRSRNLRPELSWTVEADAVSYRLQVARDPSFNDLVPVEPEPGTNRYLPTQDLPEGELFWRVASRDEAGNHSQWSQVDRFEIDITPPQKPRPKEMSPNPTRERQPILAWEKVPDAETYHIQVASEASFSQPILDERVATSTLRASRLLPEGDIFWRVQSIDTVGNESGYSPVSWFEVDVTPPALARLDPIPEPIREPRFTLRWQPVREATIYLVEIDRDAGFNAPREETTADPWLELQGLSEGTWFWRVASQDEAGNWSQYSASGQFNVDRTAPPPPELIPVDMSQGRFPYLHWESVPEVESYVVQLSYEPNFGDLLHEVEVDSTWFQVDRVLPPGRVYWRVASRDSAGNEGRFSAPGAFDLY